MEKLEYIPGTAGYVITCEHCLICAKNEIGESLAFCDMWGEWRNITRGDCFGNCESEKEGTYSGK